MARSKRCSRFYSNGLVAKWHRTSLSALHWHSPASHCSGRARLIVAADHRGVHASRATRACLRERGRSIVMRCDCRQWSSRARTLGFMGLRNGMNSSKDKHKGWPVAFMDSARNRQNACVARIWRLISRSDFWRQRGARPCHCRTTVRDKSARAATGEGRPLGGREAQAYAHGWGKRFQRR